jgi:hypothetical protein
LKPPDLSAVLKLAHGRVPEPPDHSAGSPALEMERVAEENRVEDLRATNREHSYLSAEGYARLYGIVAGLIDASPEGLAYNDDVAAAAVQRLELCDLEAIVMDWLEGRGNEGLLL